MATGRTEIINNCSVYLSYQIDSQDKVKNLYQALYSNGIKPWMDIYNIKAGTGMNILQTLAITIQTCDLVLACVNRKYVQSKSCEQEINYADCFNKPIIPLYIEKIPIVELGNVGILLAREKFCNLYRDEKIFDNISHSDAFIDILHSIEHVLKSKGKIFTKALLTKTEKQDPFSLNERITNDIVQFRNDQPFEIFISVPLEENEELETTKIVEKSNNVNTTKPSTAAMNAASKISKVVSFKKTGNAAFNNHFKQPSLPNFNQIKENEKEKATKKSKLSEVKFNQTLKLVLEVHPLIKDLEYLRRPKILIDPKGDRIYGENNKIVYDRGGFPYHKPIGWQRFGLKISLFGYPSINWIAKDGNPDEWCVAYHGIKSPRYLQSVLFNENYEFNANFKPGMRQLHKASINNNKKSDNYNKQCGIGVYFSSKIELAQDNRQLFVVDDTKYKVVLQCRINPYKLNIPQSAPDIYVVNKNIDIRPYAILVRKVNSSSNKLKF